MWLTMARNLPGMCFQTGFLRGRQAAEGVLAIRRCLEITHEHGHGLVLLSVDLKSALDSFRRSAVIRALGHKHAPSVLLGLTAKLLSGLQCTLKLGNSVS